MSGAEDRPALLTDEQVQEIRERLAKSTPGPWIAEYSAEQGNCVIPADAESTRGAVCVTRLYYQVADAEFIAHAPTDIAALLADRDARSRCGAEAVGEPSWIPCMLPVHDTRAPHWSTSGCAGGQVTWRDA